MYLMYVDESGDPGRNVIVTRYFILTGLVIHELRWKTTLDSLVQFRAHLRTTKGLKMREEIHASNFMSRPGELIRIRRNDRVDIIKQCIIWAASHPDLGVITIRVDKQGVTRDPFEIAWDALINRFENTIRHKNFPGPCNSDDKGLILPDNTDVMKLTGLLRKMRVYNPIPNRMDIYGGGFRNSRIENIVEDPFFKDSRSSYFHQITDVIAYAARQIYEPNVYLSSKGGRNLYQELDPILIKRASRTNPMGVVEL